mmetsp:Transcript_26962/g.48663  ORF Transcript_26962/g.48663 Transcript_26962/m.48663 type:complete len:228 (-) Transcript_26962:150-833(-)|eukprot:CAMPEP_0201932176 /NCGR_PEP_ID=MMETSP0903-20130614/28918_1 /ASSEMBLY_ACC=CAM_ASM_000552 /TAXON_ID=420261 /ORGANISM="Thalassiosira antarctica, Strain CCMP982" /LENGTH=227 /DNA_ID=CAMNT_0048471713 /DNA_START=124 /DNA_END=807 /DNA_ORIENTATION=+
MNLKYAVAIVLGLPIVVYGDSLRGTQEKDDVVDQKDDAADLEDRRILKMNAAQKRLIQRDKRQRYENPDRTQSEELAARVRKWEQSLRRGRPEADPNNPDYGAPFFIEGREINRYARCRATGRGCGFVTDPATYTRLVTRDARRAYRRARLYDSEYDSGLLSARRAGRGARLDDIDDFDNFDCAECLTENCFDACLEDLSYELDTYDYDQLESRADQLGDYYDEYGY